MRADVSDKTAAGQRRGESLDRLLDRGPVSIEAFLPMAVELAESLQAVHRQRGAHTAVSPATILWNPSTGHLELSIDDLAGSAPERCRAEAAPQEPSVLPYLSPEQIGRASRLVDSRSDLYSLGITFYQMLTGALPFAASDALEWAHCHVARMPRSPREVQAHVPPGLSDVVMRLLAKAAEDRYQTALGLKWDLQRCLKMFRATHDIPSSPLGENDVPDRLFIPQKLYGREAEVGALQNAFQSVHESGVPQLVLVAGHPGVGKTSLIGELSGPAVAARAFFVSGKFDPFQRDVPYPTLVEAFRELIHQVLTQSEAQIGEWRQHIQRAVDVNGRVIVDVLPEVELIIGAQPKVPELPPTESRNRFDMVFRRFLGAFTTKDHPLVLVLDDLQWVDPASLRLVEAVMSDRETRHLLMVGAYRDNEVGATHPLVLARERLREAGASVRTIPLAPLTFDAACTFIADTLHSDVVRVEPLAKLIFEKTGGNPFFLTQFLTNLHNERLLELDGLRHRWRWTLEGIRRKDYTDNIVDLLARKLNRLPATTQVALAWAACIGVRFDQGMLEEVHPAPDNDAQAALDLATQERLVVSVAKGRYAFAHDRIQQAAHSLFGEGERRQAHLRIGRTWLARCQPEELRDRLFEIAGHFNAALEEITSRDEKRGVAALNIEAAQRAIHSTAYASAQQFALAAWSLLQPADWNSDYALLRSLYETMARTEYLNGHLERCTQLVCEAVGHLHSSLEKDELYQLLILAQTLRGAYEEAVQSGREALSLLGMELPTSDYEEAIGREVQEIDRVMGERHPSDFLDAPLLTDPAQSALRAILNSIGYPASVTVPPLSQMIAAKSVLLSLRHGISKESCQSFAEHGILLGQDFNQCRRAYEFAQLGLKLADRLQAIEIKCKASCTMAEAVLPWARPLREGLPILEEGMRAGIASGDLEWVGYSLVTQTHLQFCAGEPLPAVQATLESSLEQVSRYKHLGAIEILEMIRHTVLALRGAGAGLEEELKLAAECGTHGNRFALCFHHSHLAQRLLYEGQYEEALRHAGEARELTRHFMGATLRADATFHHALAVLGVLAGRSAEAKAELREELSEDLALLRLWAEACPANFAHKHALAEAEAARVAGSVLEATDRYEAAIASARENAFLQGEALASELAARFYAERGWSRLSKASLVEAHECYARWGARAKVKQLEESAPWLVAVAPPASPEPSATSGSALDTIAVLHASQAISREIELSRLVDTLMRTVVERAGAQTGYLVLLEGDELRVESRARTSAQGLNIERLSWALSPLLLPATLLNYVRRTHGNVVLGDASRHHAYAADPYILQYKPVSVLCLPLLHRSTLVGVLYLENNLMRNAFSAERIALLSLLTSQIAISLENARAYEALRSSEKRVRELLDTSPIPIAMHDRQERVLLVNMKFTESFGYATEDVPTLEQWWLLAHPDPRERETIKREWLRRTEEAVRSHREVVPLEAKVRCKDGTERYVEVRGAPIGDQMVVAYSDLTERRQTELEREHLVEEAQSASRAKDRLLAVLSHELRNPLAAIRAGVDLLRRTQVASERPAERALTVIERNTEMQARLVNDLLDLSRIARGKLELRRAPVQLDTVLGLAAQAFLAEAERAQISLELEAEPGLWVNGDVDRLQQVVMNLLSNALKFTPAGGKVTASAHREDGRGRIVVADTGIGIDASRIPTLFETFQTGDGGFRRGSGLGLGLALVKSLTELHGGSVRAQSAGSGQGSVFEVRLPLVEAPGRRAAAAEGSQLAPRDIRLIYIEDNPDTRSLVVEALQMLGYQVFSAESGEQALHLLAREPVDVILSDIGLPGMDGYDCLRMARQIPGLAKTPAFAVTGYGQERDRKLARQAGFVEHFVKPLDLATLDEAIRRNLVG